MSEKNQIREIIQSHSSSFKRQLYFQNCLLAASSLAVLLSLAAAADIVLSFREQQAFTLVVLCLAATVLCLITAFHKRRYKANVVIHSVEDEHPDFMDSLHCAVELIEADKELSIIEEELIRKVAQKLASTDVKDAGRKKLFSKRLTISLVLICLCLFSLSHISTLANKFRAHMADLHMGHTSGLIVEPGTIEIAEGEDILIKAKINRGPDDSVMIYIRKGLDVKSYPMYKQGDKRFSFEIFGVDESFDYQIITGYFISEWYGVKMFKKPSIVETLLTVIPPKYTREATDSFTQIQDMSMLEGSTVKFFIKTDRPAKLLFDNFENKTAFTTQSDLEHSFSFQLKKTMKFRLLIDDLRGHEIIASKIISIQAIDDYAPTLIIKSPDKDPSTHEKNDLALFVVELSDDYGVSEIKMLYTINGDHEKEMFFEFEKNSREFESASVLDLTDLVENGDIVSYYFIVKDNREPKRNVLLSDLRVIEVRPEKPEPKEAKGGEGQKKTQLTVRHHIEELHFLMRQTHALKRQTDSEFIKDSSLDLGKEVGELHNSILKNFDKIRKNVKKNGGELGPFEKLFSDTTRDISRAEDLLNKSLPDESISYMTGALSHLVKVEIAIMPSSKAKGKGKGEGEEDKSKSEKNDKKEEDKAKQKDREFLSRLKEVYNAQKRLSSELAVDAKMTNERFLYFNNIQMKQKNKLVRISKEMRDLKKNHEVYLELRKAENSMQETVKQFKYNNITNAKKSSKFTENFLSRAIKLLEEKLRQQSKKEMEKLAADLKGLIKKQQGLEQKARENHAKGKGKVSRKDALEMAKKESEIAKELNDINEKLESKADKLSDKNPDFAKQLKKLLDKTQKDQIGKDMKRAGNALKYRRFDKASEEMKKALAKLKKFQKDLADKLKNGDLSEDELMDMLSETVNKKNKAKATEKGGSPQAKAQEEKDIKKHLQKLAKKLNDKEMKNLANKSKSMGNGGTDQKGSALLAEAARIIERRLFEKIMKRKLKLSRMQDQKAPDEYQRLVKKYFKELSEVD